MTGGAGARVVSLTPLALETDSRTFKQAASMARLGYDSVVVEGAASTAEAWPLPFELRTAPAEEDAGAARPPAPPRRLAAAVGGHLRTFSWRHANRLHRRSTFLWRNGPATARELPQAALYWLHSPNQAAALFLGRRRPFVYDAHDFYPSFWDAEDPSTRILLALERRCMRTAAEVVTTTEGYADLYAECYGRRPLVIPNVHDPRIDEPPPQRLRAALGLGEDAFLIVAVGNAKPGTAVDEALTAMAELPETVHLAFVGGGWNAYRERVSERGLDARVHLLAPVPPSQVAPFIADADLATLLYYPLNVDYLYALPNRLFIPVASGLPLLYPSALRELSAVAEKHGFGIPFDSRDPQSFAEGVRPLVEDGGRLKPLREAAARARTILSWEREEERLGEIVERAIGARR